MRSSSKSRSRNKGSGRNRNVGNIINRVFDSAGPEGKVRGTPQQIIEKYQTLTRDAQLSGDRVAAENFQQHAEHYLRMLNEAQREQAERQAADARNRPSNQQQDQGGDGDGGGQDRQDRQDQRQDRGGNANGNRQASGDDNREFAPVIDPGQKDTGLVDTPESKSDSQPESSDQPPRSRGRTRRSAKSVDGDGGDRGGKDAPSTAEAAEGSTVS